MPLCYLLSLNPTSYGILKNLRGSGFKVHLFHVGGGLENLLDHSAVIHRHSIDRDPESVVDVLCRRPGGEIGMVFTSSDQEISFLERFRKELAGHVSLPLLAPELVQLLNNKYALFRRASELGIASPRSCCISRTDLAAAVPDLSWPCLIKPVFSEEWKTAEASRVLRGEKAVVVPRPADLATLAGPLWRFSSRLLVQEIIRAEEHGSYSFCSYSGHDGRVLWGFVTQKLLQYPAHFGTAILCATVDQPAIAAFGRSVVESLGVCGISETEILLDRRTGSLVLIEVNTRHWLQHRLSTLLGVNMSLLDYYYRTGNHRAVHDLLGQPNDRRPALWIDDLAYLSHALKHWHQPRALHLQSFRGRTLEFSLLEAGSFHRLISMFLKRLWPSEATASLLRRC